ncbi:hypothetical protein TNCV_3153641 [Trichonephila clavipes]|nr:hypothetical protein TNCV_3153641 [Trichonephila clavipes]
MMAVGGMFKGTELPRKRFRAAKRFPGKQPPQRYQPVGDSQVTRTKPEMPISLSALSYLANERTLSLDNLYISSSTRRVFSGTWLELMTRPPRARDHNH